MNQLNIGRIVLLTATTVDFKRTTSFAGPLSLSELEELNAKASGGKVSVSERNDINVGRLVHYAATMVEDEKTTAPVAKRHISETQTKHRRVEQLYGRHLVRLGATMAKNNQTTAFDQSHKLSTMV